MLDPFILRFEAELRSYCRMLTGTPWDADDLYQDTLMKALKSQGKLLAHPAPRAYLFRIASNAWIDECRKRKADIGLPNGHEALSAEIDIYALESKDSLELLVSSVPPFQAAVVLLADVFDYSAREIADMLKTTEGAAKAALHRARKRLAALAKEHGEASEAARLSSPKTEEQISLIKRFLSAFRLREPMAIAAAYRSLSQTGIRAERRLLRGKPYFTFYDPEGNAFTIAAE